MELVRIAGKLRQRASSQALPRTAALLLGMAMLSFPCLGITLTNHMVTKAVNTYGACAVPTPATSFSSTDPSVWVWFYVSDAAAGDVAGVNWYDPNGNLYGPGSGFWPAAPAAGPRCDWWTLGISGTPVASIPGTWTVKVSWNGAALFSSQFTITAGGGLDSGTWPTLGHDNQRSGQAGVFGPGSPSAPRLVKDLGSAALSDVTVASNGHILLASCSLQNSATVPPGVQAIGATGTSVWTYPLAKNEGSTGLTVAANGQIYASTQVCPVVAGQPSTNFYALQPAGSLQWSVNQGSVSYPPAVGADGSVFVLDQQMHLRAYSATGSLVWSRTLTGTSEGAIALDSSGNIYIGTNASQSVGSSFWSYGPTGAFRWSAGRGSLGTPVISPAGAIYVADVNGALYSYNPDGSQKWSYAAGGTASLNPLAVGASETVYLQTSAGLYAVNPDGSLKWKYAPGGTGGSPGPVLDLGENVFAAFGSTVYSMTPDGTLRWTSSLASPGRLLIGGASTLYAVSANQKLYALADTALNPDPSPADKDTALIPQDSTPIGTRTPLILIHGVHGNQQADGADTIINPNANYFSGLIGRWSTGPALTQYKIYRYQYVSDKYTVTDLARALRNDLDAQIIADSGFDQTFVIVGHGMGGLVARAYMNYMPHYAGVYAGQLGGQRVQKLITLATPHHGTPGAGDSTRALIASSPAWQGSQGSLDLTLADFWAVFQTDVTGCLPVTSHSIPYSQPNRQDALWDNFDSRFSSTPPSPELNAWLAKLNSVDEKYFSKLVVYDGYLLAGDPRRAALAAAQNVSSNSPGQLGIAACQSWLNKDQHGLLLAANLALDYGLQEIYEENDGFAPRSSTSLKGGAASKVVECPGLDYLDMKDGGGSACANGLTLYSSLDSDLAVGGSSPVNIAGLTNAASFAAGQVVPGEIITIFGTGIGPADLETLVLDANGRVGTNLSGTQVLFDGVAAPLIYASSTQVSAIVPYDVYDKPVTNLTVQYQGGVSAPLSVVVGSAAPGIFSMNASGTGQGAILNQDYSLNSATAPAAPGSYISIFATGEGQTNPPGINGQIISSSLPSPMLPVTVTIGGLPATVAYAGGSPGSVAGLLQVNVRVPDNVKPGPAVPVQLSVGTVTSQSGITMVIAN